MTIVICLAIGWVFFILYNLKKGYRFTELLKFSGSGIYNARVVLLTLALVGVLTALWRSAGTISYIVTYSIRLVQPGILLLCIFLLNSMVSFLIGTSFGTSATMGVICMILANASGISPVLSGGAVMSGIFFGDRCSPLSSSAMLVASVTETSLYDNLRNMFISARIPFTLTCILYLVIGFVTGRSDQGVASLPDFSVEFHLVMWTLLPAIVVIVLSLFKVQVRTSIIISCICASFVCLFVQEQSISFLLRTMLFGFEPTHAELSRLISGGGLLSMKKVLCIVGISSTYSGLIKNTDMSNVLSSFAEKMNTRFSRIGCVVIVSFLSTMVGCNQTLAIMLTNQFCEHLYLKTPNPDKQITQEKQPNPDRQNLQEKQPNPDKQIIQEQPLTPEEEAKIRSILALDLEDTVVMISALVPWCIAGAVPIATIGAPTACLFAGFYLYLIPICRYISVKNK